MRMSKQTRENVVDFLSGGLCILVMALAVSFVVGIDKASAQVTLNEESVLKGFMEKGAADKCEEFVEYHATHQHRWEEDGRYPRWQGPSTFVLDGRVVYLFHGSSVHFQNGYGAWTRVKYVCGVDPLMTKVLAFEVTPFHDG